MPDGVDDRRIGLVVRSLRMINGLSMQQLSERTGFHYQSIARYESGGATIPAAFIYRAAQALGVSPGAFYEGVGEAWSVAKDGDGSGPSAAEVAEFVRLWRRIPHAGVRNSVRTLVATLAKSSSRGR